MLLDINLPLGQRCNIGRADKLSPGVRKRYTDNWPRRIYLRDMQKLNCSKNAKNGVLMERFFFFLSFHCAVFGDFPNSFEVRLQLEKVVIILVCIKGEPDTLLSMDFKFVYRPKITMACYWNRHASPNMKV